MIERLKNEAGYSLVEVMASIVILTIAIIPMVVMFDMGLNSATASGNYDKARAFANKKLEQARSLSYEGVRDDFPRTGDGTPTAGSPASIDGTTEAGVPQGFSYTVSKRFKCVSTSSTSCVSPVGAAATSSLADSGSDLGLIEVTVIVSWGGDKSYSAVGIVGREAL